MSFKDKLDECGSDTTFFRAIGAGLLGSMIVGVIGFTVANDAVIEKSKTKDAKSDKKVKKKI